MLPFQRHTFSSSFCMFHENHETILQDSFPIQKAWCLLCISGPLCWHFLQIIISVIKASLISILFYYLNIDLHDTFQVWLYVKFWAKASFYIFCSRSRYWLISNAYFIKPFSIRLTMFGSFVWSWRWAITWIPLDNNTDFQGVNNR